MYERILVPIDGSPTSTAGLQAALQMARLTHGRLNLVHVIDEFSLAAGFVACSAMRPDWIPSLKQAGQKVLDDARAIAERAGITCDICLIETLSGDVPRRVLAEAAAWQANLIVLGTHGRRGVQRLVLGSDAMKIVRGASVPVLLVRGAPESRAAMATSAVEQAPA